MNWVVLEESQNERCPCMTGGYLVSKDRVANARPADDRTPPPSLYPPYSLPCTRVPCPRAVPQKPFDGRTNYSKQVIYLPRATLSHIFILTSLSSYRRPSAPIGNIPSSAGGGGIERLSGEQAARRGRSQPAPKRQRGAAVAGEGSAVKSGGGDNERSRRRLAAFLSRDAVAGQSGVGADARSLASPAHEPGSPRGGPQRWGSRCTKLLRVRSLRPHARKSRLRALLAPIYLTVDSPEMLDFVFGCNTCGCGLSYVSLHTHTHGFGFGGIGSLRFP